MPDMITKTETDTDSATFKFQAKYLPKFADGMTKLAKVARKLSVPPMQWHEVSRETVTETYVMPNGTEVPTDVEYVTVTVCGTSPKLSADYAYVGTVEHLPDGNILKTFNSGAFGRAAERGDRYVIKGTVKDHDSYTREDGTVTLSTMLARVAIVETLHEDGGTVPCGDAVRHAHNACDCP